MDDSRLISLLTPGMSLDLFAEGDRLRVEGFGAPGRSWLGDAPPGLFGVEIDGQRYDASSLPLVGVGEADAETGITQIVARFGDGRVQVDHHLRGYEGAALVETWQTVRNVGGEPLHVTRVDSLAWSLLPDEYTLLHYDSDWGREFDLRRVSLREAVTLETRCGRASKGQHPWFALIGADGAVFSGAVAWSGNWVMRFEPGDGGVLLSGGLHDWAFARDLLPGESLDTPRVIVALGADLNAASQQFARVGRQWWYPRNALSAQLPVEWNHWWSYEDRDIDENVFRANVDAAAAMGCEIAVLDAGWFGPSEAGSPWYALRGDWDRVNRARFPSGLAALADYTRAKGLKFGLWCEIEGLGEQAALADDRPDFPALRDGERLGYVCLGNPAAEDWAYAMLARLIEETACDWVKLDFNVDPGAGCNRTDHGHGAGDGLLAHYHAYYRVLDRLRARFPEVVLENCSSGGLRIDLEMLRHTHLTFLSDPDWPTHDLQIFWGASTMLAPDACLHWSFSEWCNPDRPVQQTFDPRDPALTPHQLDTYTRIAMLGAMGISQKLPDLPDWVRARLAGHIRVYREQVRRFVREADVFRLTDQPQRDGSSDRWCAFQYRLPDGAAHLLFVFRLAGAEASRAIRLARLRTDCMYTVETVEGERIAELRGRDLMDAGLRFDNLPEDGSTLLKIAISG
ncbi:alpha-galactosidase [Aggregatilinea lenta]|uniref:alpha-galactosidase n=1 Tax=Aggregatilinea lenta TaxID=913108 RepID=UPI000E5A514F|nr:alpha-galactosidase [Aggregatilinea lenta]